MAKNPNSSPKKGFTDELAQASKLKTAQAKKPFTWHKTVAGVAPTNDLGAGSMQKSAARGNADQNLVNQQKNKIAKRRGI